jgi:hypothetical protein
MDIFDIDAVHESEECCQEAPPSALSNAHEIETLGRTLVRQIDELEQKLKYANEDIQMLKQYILDGGLKPFWEHDGLKKSPQKMTVKELADANAHTTLRQEGVKVRESKDSVPKPSYEAEAKMYEDRIKEHGPEINWLVEAFEKNKDDET